jgi:hypothetical protein
VSPEAFEAMAGADRTFAQVAPIVHQLARKALGLDDGAPVTSEDARPPRRAARPRTARPDR